MAGPKVAVRGKPDIFWESNSDAIAARSEATSRALRPWSRLRGKLISSGEGKGVDKTLLGGSSHLVSGLVHPSYKWTLPPLIPFIARVVSPTYDPWDEPPSCLAFFVDFQPNLQHPLVPVACEQVQWWDAVLHVLQHAEGEPPGPAEGILSNFPVAWRLQTMDIVVIVEWTWCINMHIIYINHVIWRVLWPVFRKNKVLFSWTPTLLY